ncbi:hypothetical protein F991_03307 [Acinetobacter sp. CIP-A165]|uniref:GNAT family N-acetyltransferase n=1 Tax=Acinetobacter sp. CIP-A165 TaxID=40373 RepID=UPI0002CE31BD|nr:GNAT family N-acetyltransferase [Acinetobacter sp. CIP-A165]ENU29175.1 hypothetical protein F991_03307 [Acinetobacter sp. CIP-A165]
MMNIEIKILNVSDINDFRNIRLAALLNAPKMFGSSYAVELNKPLAFFQNCLSNSIVFGAYHGKEIVALATLTQETVAKISHKAYLSSVFVQPEFQNKGIANELIQAVIEHSNKHIEQILLTVADDNNSAIHLYKKLGFQIYGVEHKALKDHDNMEYTDELMMKLFL